MTRTRRAMNPIKPAAAALGAAALMVCTIGAGNAWAEDLHGTVHTHQSHSLAVRSTPHTSANTVGSLADGTNVEIDCQLGGDPVSGTYGTSTVWDHVPAKGGYVSDAYVRTGSDKQVAPTCPGGGGGGAPTAQCDVAGLNNPRSCADAVNWLVSHITTKDGHYFELCDNTMARAYGFPHSDSGSAILHWEAIPARYRHVGLGNAASAPAGALMFFENDSYGHVAMSTGGTAVISTDINGHGTLTRSSVAQITHKWGARYLGWANPWFKANH